ncbi:hypothetical protein [Streptomyces chrestomyceticus]|uniref:hypothetical protein n=1 Tax=Streptomyces chrestomyceticus TaxID=68185 RepID=UPI00340DACE0
MSSAPERPRLHVVDLTAADGAAVFGFLVPRLHAQMDGQYGTPAYRTAAALDAIVRRAEFAVRHHADNLAADSFYDRGERLRCLHSLQDAWNTLMDAVFAWREEQGYDTARWVHIDYLDALDAARGEALEAQVQAEIDAQRPAPKKR